MQKISKFLLDLLLLRTRWSRIVNASTALLMIGYVILLVNPSILYAHHHQMGNFHLYDSQPFPENTDEILASVEDKLSHSSYYIPEKDYHIFICRENWRFRLLTPLGSRKYSFGNTYQIIQNIYLNTCDIGKNEVYNFNTTENVRPLDVVIAHEVSHVNLEDEYGLIKFRLMPGWKNEGFCEWVGESRIPGSAEIESNLQIEKEDLSPRKTYVRYWLMTHQALDNDHMTARDFIEKDHDPESLLNSLNARRESD